MLQYLIKKEDIIVKNITIVSLSDTYGKEVAEKFANSINYYFADAGGILSYNFVNDEMASTCGMDYFLNLKESSMQDISKYENTVTYMSAPMFLSIVDKEKYLASSILLYLYLPMDKFMTALYNDVKLEQSEREVEILQYDNRDALLKKYATHTVPNKTLGVKSAIKQINNIINI